MPAKTFGFERLGKDAEKHRNAGNSCLFLGDQMSQLQPQGPCTLLSSSHLLGGHPGIVQISKTLRSCSMGSPGCQSGFPNSKQGPSLGTASTSHAPNTSRGFIYATYLSELLRIMFVLTCVPDLVRLFRRWIKTHHAIWPLRTEQSCWAELLLPDSHGSGWIML